MSYDLVGPNTGSGCPIPPIWQNIGASYWSSWKAHLDCVIAKNAQTESIAFIQGVPPGGWFGGVLAPNGKIYCVPQSATSILVIDPSNDTWYTFGSGSLSGNTWTSGVLAPNGKIYCCPGSATQVLVIDPSNDTFYKFGSLPAGKGKWHSSVLAPGGIMYGIPALSTAILRVDTKTDTAATFGGPFSSLALKWLSACLAPNGNIYCVPGNETGILKIDPATDMATIVDNTYGLSGITKSYSAGLSPHNGCIYGICPSSNPGYVIKFDPMIETHSTLPVAGLVGSDGWSGGALAGNGVIYGMPVAASCSSLLKINPLTDTVSKVASTFVPVGNKYRGGVLAMNGKIYSVMAATGDICIVTPDTTALFDSNVPLAGHWNKF